MSEWFVRSLVMWDSVSEKPASREITFHPTPGWPDWLIPLLGLGSIFIVGWLLRRETARPFRRVTLWLLRSLAIMILLFMMAGWMRREHRTELPELVLAFDVSASMDTPENEASSTQPAKLATQLEASGLASSTRLNLVKLLLLDDNARVLTSLAERYRLRFFTLGEQANSISPLNNAERTVTEISSGDASSRLGSGLRDILESQRGRSTSAVILFSDGINTAGPALADAAALAQRQSIPLYCIAPGYAHSHRDFKLLDLIVERDVFVNDIAPFDVLVSRNTTAACEVAIELRTPDRAEPLSTEKVRFAEGEKTQRIRLTHRPDREGSWTYELRIVNSDPDEQPANDRIETTIEVHNATLRVLLVQGAPSFEYRFLKNLLERELNTGEAKTAEKAGFQVWLQQADLLFPQIDRSAISQFPVSREELFAYDVLILGDADPALLTSSMQENLRDFVVEKGGGIMFVAGPRFMPLAWRASPVASLFPFDPATARIPLADDELTTEVHPQPTSLGIASGLLDLVDSPAENRLLWSQQLPGIYWYLDTPDMRPAARTLLAHPVKADAHGLPAPLLSLQFVGAGKVLFQSFDGSWRWRLRAGDDYLARYWIPVIRYLARGKLSSGQRGVEVSTDREEYQRGETIQLRVRFDDPRPVSASDANVTLQIERTGDARRQLSATRTGTQGGLFVAEMTDAVAGYYQATLLSPMLAGQPAGTTFRVLPPPGETARQEMDLTALQAAAELTGGKFALWKDADGLWSQLPTGQPVRVATERSYPLWNSPWLAIGFIGLLIVEWMLRKFWSLA